jgi:chemotaxis protein MotB
MTPASSEDSSDQSKGKSETDSGGATLEASPTTTAEIEASSSTEDEEMQNVSVGAGALDESMDGALFKLPATIPFRGSNATIDDEEMHLFIKRVADIIKTLPATVDISVRGYTDDQALPRGSAYRDNLDLSSARAATVVRALMQNGVSADRLSSAGFGAAKPLVSNSNETNRAKNRRVEFYMFIANNKKLDKVAQKSILDIVAKLPKE